METCGYLSHVASCSFQTESFSIVFMLAKTICCSLVVHVRKIVFVFQHSRVGAIFIV